VDRGTQDHLGRCSEGTLAVFVGDMAINDRLPAVGNVFDRGISPQADVDSAPHYFRHC
jgi:hypothetical protein